MTPRIILKTVDSAPLQPPSRYRTGALHIASMEIKLIHNRNTNYAGVCSFPHPSEPDPYFERVAAASKKISGPSRNGNEPGHKYDKDALLRYCQWWPSDRAEIGVMWGDLWLT